MTMGSSAFDALEGKSLSWLLGVVADAMLLFDGAGRVVLANPPAQRLFGYNCEEISGLTVEDLIPLRFRDTHRAKRAEYAKRPARRMAGTGLDIYGFTKAGREFDADISLSPVGNGLVLAGFAT